MVIIDERHHVAAFTFERIRKAVEAKAETHLDRLNRVADISWIEDLEEQRDAVNQLLRETKGDENCSYSCGSQ